jgi:hypothetical protein
MVRYIRENPLILICELSGGYDENFLDPCIFSHRYDVGMR